MRIIQTANYHEMSRTAAILLLNRLLENPRAAVGLATGHTPTGLYHAWVAAQQELQVDLSGVHFFHLDEYLGLGPEHPESMGAFLQHHLFAGLGVPSEQVHFVPATAPEPEAACVRYEQEIKAYGGIALQILGIGGNGHIAFNEPGTPFDQRMHLADLSPETQAANARYFADGQTPSQAMTLGLANIMTAERIVLLASGAGKAQAVAAMLTGPIDERCPASILRFHPHVTLILDQAAAALLPAQLKAPVPPTTLKTYLATERLLPGQQKILVAAPHPDDASISCGGTLARLKDEGHHLCFVSMTSGHRADMPDTTSAEERTRIRAAEAEAEAQLFGGEMVHLALPFYEHAYHPSRVDFETVGALLRRYQPDLILSASPRDRHPAHRMSALILQEAVRRYGQEYPEPPLWFYEGPWFLFERDEFNTVVVLEEPHVTLKNQGIQAHASQVGRKRYDLAAEALARFRAITTPESRAAAFGGGEQDFGLAAEVFLRSHD
jgi:glucosamine-6-phosphate deaminase